MQSLVVLIDGSENDAASLKCACALARAAGGRLTVVHTKAAEVLPAGAYEIAVAAIDNSAYAQETLKRARAAFAEVCGNSPDARLMEIDASAAEAIQRVSPYHDMILLERVSDLEGPDAVAFSTALWGAHCPVLVNPPDKVHESIKHVAIAWNGSIQAGRAMRAALPFLQKAVQVTVLQRAGVAEDLDLQRYLQAHGVKTVAFRSYGEKHLTARGWGRALLAAAQEAGTDLLVMGAYGSTMGSLLGFGRTTEKIVTSSPIPVLLSA